ncbi:MAG: hypothetical protein K6F76_08465 [Clostridiales bacterium]|nr:hypothetical protein [Clostridiales bacterium]
MDSIIERIISADEQARQILNEAKHTKDSAGSTLKDNEAKITEEYKQQTHDELERHRALQEETALSAKKTIEADFENAMLKLENAEKENFSRWVSEITESIIYKLSND